MIALQNTLILRNRREAASRRTHRRWSRAL